MKLYYPAVFHSEDGSYWVEFPDLPGCSSFGDTLDETFDMAREALEGYCIDVIESGGSLPSPRSLEEVRKDYPDDPSVFISMIDSDISAYLRRGRAVKKTLTIPSWLNDEAMSRGINFSAALSDALLRELRVR